MSTRYPPYCPHDLRPGTAVCLHCLREERLAARERLERFLMRGAAVAAATVVLIFIGSHAMDALEARRSGGFESAAEAATIPPDHRRVAEVIRTASAPQPPAERSAAAAAVRPATLDLEPPPAAVNIAAPRAEPPPAAVDIATPRAEPPAVPTPTGRPVALVPTGRTELSDGVFVERYGDTITVYFDTPELRTRRTEKFERTVRSTLPRLYGPVADSLLARVAPGGLVGSADLLYELPWRGVQLPTSGSPVLTIWPRTRPGQEGPLVVSYRVIPAR